ncbi:MAG: methyltransferase domain-containing protein [Candidatus Pacebacteria bacterium]|jgi:SAM-dependent methyltransferase|nr:methyltransferase domain-containing protein [Candidatus Paceibacterota bacterium]MDP6659703.1 methyltransferase domain-containing protein [Candidatus Paceibacterota bacterium]
MNINKERLKDVYYDGVPNARRINPIYRSIFEFLYIAHKVAKPDSKVLNIYASQDFSGKREEIYRTHFFNHADYYGVDFWHDKFIPEGKIEKDVEDQKRYVMPYEDNTFDVVLTTKVIMEHVSEPREVVKELHRVLKPGGEIFIVAPLVRRQHQIPHDYFRFTEFGIRYLLEKEGFSIIDIAASNGFMATAVSYAYFFERGLNIPKPIEKIFDFIHKWVVEPIGYGLDRLDNGYGRDFTRYFLVRARK